MEYYIIINGERRGPFRRDELAGMNLEASTLVWRSGMPEWQPIANVPELSGLYSSNSDTLYYAMIGGHRVGPAPIASLIEAGATYQTDVWCENMSDWQPASSVPEFNEMLRRHEASRRHTAHTYSTPQPPQFIETPHTNWMGWAIAGTVLGFFCSCIGGIFGIIAIVKANNANRAYAMGDSITGRTENSTAKTMTIISLVMTILGFVGNIILGISGALNSLVNVL